MNRNRFTAGLLSLALLLSGVNTTFAGTQTWMREDRPAVELDIQNLAELQKTPESDFLQEENKKQRIIVELEGSSLLEEAIERGVEYTDLPQERIESRKREMKVQQNEVLHELKEKEIEVDTADKRHYDTVMNAVALEANEEDIETIEALEGVKRVYIAQEYERPQLHSSKDIVGASYAWDTLGYKGEGTVVAVIDSGIDYRHKALRIDEDAKVKLSREATEEMIREQKLPGKYYSSKVPYAYNYYDLSNHLKSSYSVMHGMHVSGIVGANDESGTVRGLAPNTQILAMKVFSDDLRYPTTFTDVWLKAMDDALALKADVINMSLGAAAGFSMEDRSYPEVELIRKARQAGVTVVIAAGNDAEISKGNSYGVKPLVENYDTAELASPAVHEDGFAVASVENKTQKVNIVRWMKDNRQMQEAVHLYGPAQSLIKGAFVDLKKGEDSAIVSEKIQGKIALLEYPARGDMQKYAQKLQKIVECQPLAVVLYNAKELADQLGSNIDLQGEAGNYVVIRMKRSTYEKIAEANSQLEIPGIEQEIANPQEGRMSAFSSWGPTPDLRIKPEISAVGGNVYSTAEEDRYKNMSGTSMAAPQVAGAAAVLRQYLRDRKIPTDNEADFVKLLLMNTAKPLEDPESEGGTTPYFVRRQGSGVMMLDKALQSKVVVRASGTNDGFKDGKLELKELEEKRFDVNLEFENFSDTDKTYYISMTALRERMDSDGRSGHSAPLGGNQDQFYEQVHVPANRKTEFHFTADYTDTDLERNQFLEGFIHINDSEESVDLNVPFLGFYGDWDTQKSIDAFTVPELDAENRPVQFYVNQELNVSSSAFSTKRMLPLPIVDRMIYFSPEGIYHSEAAVRLAPLPNMSEIEYSILDGESMEVLRVLGVSHSVRKLSRLGRNNSFRMMPDSVWDGRIDGKTAEEGKTYIYQIKAKLNTIDKAEQIYRYAMRVDKTAPYFIGKASLTNKDHDRQREVQFKVNDAGSGIQDIYIQSVKYDRNPLGNGYIGAPKYGKYTKLRFVEEESVNGNVLPKVEDGKVSIPTGMVPMNESDSGEVFVCINGHRNKEVEVICPYFADTSHIQIALKDYLSNRISTELESGVTENYNSLQFLNFYNSIRENQVKIFVNNEPLQQYLYSTTAKKAEIRMEIPVEDKHLATLYIKKSRYRTDYILKEDKPDTENVRKYNFRYDKNTRSVFFTLDPFEGNCEIITGFKNGKMPEMKEEQEIELDLSEISMEQFKEIRLNNQTLRPKNSPVKTKTGRLKLQLVYKENANKQIERILIEQNNQEKLLRSASYFDLEEGRVSGYSASSYGIHIYDDLSADAKIRIIFKDGAGTGKSIATSSNASPSNAFRKEWEIPGTKQADHDDDKDKDEEIQLDNVDDSKYKYPVIFLTAPKLLEVFSKQSAPEGVIEVKGFVGKVKNADSIDKIEIKVFDELGNPVSETVEIDGSELTRKGLRHKDLGKTLYTGYAYPFDREIKVEGYALTIRVDVLTKAGESATIARRVLFDSKEPQFRWEVRNRELNSDKAVLKIHAEDNAFRLKVYQGDSLIASVDNSAQSLFTGGSRAEKEITIPLQEGQNEIRISTVDLANQRTEKTIYIYRTKS